MKSRIDSVRIEGGTPISRSSLIKGGKEYECIRRVYERHRYPNASRTN